MSAFTAYSTFRRVPVSNPHSHVYIQVAKKYIFDQTVEERHWSVATVLHQLRGAQNIGHVYNVLSLDDLHPLSGADTVLSLVRQERHYASMVGAISENRL